MTDLETVQAKVLAAAIEGARQSGVGQVQIVGSGRDRLVHVTLPERVVVYQVSVKEVARS